MIWYKNNSNFQPNNKQSNDSANKKKWYAEIRYKNPLVL